MPASSCDPESGVSAVIGTVMVLAITVAGITVTLLLGLPVLEDLRDQAALESMVGQFQEVRTAVNDMQVPGTARVPGLSLPGGSVVLVPGTSLTVRCDGMDLGTYESSALVWSNNQVAAVYEFGGVLSLDDGRAYAAAMPRVSEGDEFYLSLPSIQGESAGLSGTGDHSLALELTDVARDSCNPALSLELEFAGERAEVWCEALRVRNTLVPLSPEYVPAPAQGCTSLFYPGPIEFLLTEVTIDARLQA